MYNVANAVYLICSRLGRLGVHVLLKGTNHLSSARIRWRQDGGSKKSTDASLAIN